MNFEIQEFGASASGMIRSSAGKFYKRKSPQGRTINSARKAKARA